MSLPGRESHRGKTTDNCHVRAQPRSENKVMLINFVSVVRPPAAAAKNSLSSPVLLISIPATRTDPTTTSSSSAAASHQRDGLHALPRRTIRFLQTRPGPKQTTTTTETPPPCCRPASGGGGGRPITCGKCGSPNVRIFRAAPPPQAFTPSTENQPQQHPGNNIDNHAHAENPSAAPNALAKNVKNVFRIDMPVSGGMVGKNLESPRTGGGHKSRSNGSGTGGGCVGDDDAMPTQLGRGHGSSWRRGWRYRGDNKQ